MTYEDLGNSENRVLPLNCPYLAGGGVYTKDWGKACFVVLGMEVIRTVR